MINFSATTNGFYPSDKRADYERAGTWPTDAIELTNQERLDYHMKKPPEGKQLGSDDNGRPAWVDLPPPNADQIQSRFEADIQQRLDAFAQTRNYSGIMSACTYATSTVPKFATEGQHCVNLRDATWAAAYQLLDEVLAGTRPMPSSIEDIESDLPVLEWPE